MSDSGEKNEAALLLCGSKSTFPSAKEGKHLPDERQDAADLLERLMFRGWLRFGTSRFPRFAPLPLLSVALQLSTAELFTRSGERPFNRFGQGLSRYWFREKFPNT